MASCWQPYSTILRKSERKLTTIGPAICLVLQEQSADSKATPIHREALKI